MAGLRGLHGDLRGFFVANFSDHDDVGILPQDGAQAAREGKPRLVVHLYLIDAPASTYSTWIFDGDDVD